MVDVNCTTATPSSRKPLVDYRQGHVSNLFWCRSYCAVESHLGSNLVVLLSRKDINCNDIVMISFYTYENHGWYSLKRAVLNERSWQTTTSDVIECDISGVSLS